MEKLTDLWTEVELAVKLGLPYNKESGKSKAVGNLIARGLPCFRIVGRRYFSEEALIKWFNTQESQSPKGAILEGS